MTKAERARWLADRLAAKGGQWPSQEQMPLVIEALRVYSYVLRRIPQHLWIHALDPTMSVEQQP